MEGFTAEVCHKNIVFSHAAVSCNGKFVNIPKTNDFVRYHYGNNLKPSRIGMF